MIIPGHVAGLHLHIHSVVYIVLLSYTLAVNDCMFMYACVACPTLMEESCIACSVMFLGKLTVTVGWNVYSQLYLVKCFQCKGEDNAWVRR